MWTTVPVGLGVQAVIVWFVKNGHSRAMHASLLQSMVPAPPLSLHVTEASLLTAVATVTVPSATSGVPPMKLTERGRDGSVVGSSGNTRLDIQ